MGTIVLIAYVIVELALLIAALLLPISSTGILGAAVGWTAAVGGYLLYRRWRNEKGELAALTKTYLQHLESSLREQNNGKTAEQLLREFADFCAKELGIDRVALLARRRSGFAVLDAQGVQRRDLAAVKLRCKDDLVLAVEEHQELLPLARHYQSVKRESPYAKFEFKYLLPVISGRSLSYFLLFSEPRQHSLRLLRPFLLALADQLGVYKRQEDSQSRQSQHAGKIRGQVAALEAELQKRSSGRELQSRVLLDAQNKLASVRTRDQLYNTAFELLKSNFDARTALQFQAEGDPPLFKVVRHQGAKGVREESTYPRDEKLLKFLSDGQGWAQIQSLKDKFKDSELAKSIANFGTQIVARLQDRSAGDVLLCAARKGKGFSADEGDAFGSLVKLLNLVLANLGHLEKIEEMSYTDSMTQLYNYRYFYKRLKEEILRAQRFSRELGLVIFDIDGFKVFNDTYGHQSGDHLLRQLGRLLTASVRSVDIVSRYGGEEFCIIMPETGPEHCRTFMERLRRKILDNRFRSKFSNEHHRITVSLGGAIYPNDAQRVDRLIYCADMALLEAKASGRNKSCLYEKSLTEDKQVS